MNTKTPIYFIHNQNNHPPQALGMIRAYAKVFDGGVLNDLCNFLSGDICNKEQLKDSIGQHGRGVFLFSHYLWSEAFCLEMAAVVHELAPGSVTIHGGPSVPNYPKANLDYFQANPQIDITVRGEGEETCMETLLALATHTNWEERSFLKQVQGLSFRVLAEISSDVIRTPDRPRIQDLDQLPSPYLSGIYDSYDRSKWDAVILETNRGCPYGCTFCDWGAATKQKIRKFDLERIYKELEWIGEKRIPILWVADANFGIFPRDVEITKKICEVKAKYGYPKQIINNYTKNATARLAQIIGLLHQAGIDAPGIIAIQTTDSNTLKAIDRKNIKTERYEELAEIFRKENLPMTTDLMIGLPGATYESFLNDIQFFIDRFVAIKAYKVQVIPNSPMADPEYIDKFKIETDPRGYVISSSTFSAADRNKMSQSYKVYQLFYGFGIKKYLLYFLQFEYGILSSRYIQDFIEELFEKPTAFFPSTFMLIQQFVKREQSRHVKFSRDHWKAIYAEAEQFINHKYGIKPSPTLTAILDLQMALMPSANRTFPELHTFPFDVQGYFEQFFSRRKFPTKGDADVYALSSFEKGDFIVNDPQHICGMDAWKKSEFYDSRIFMCELDSTLNMQQLPQNAKVKKVLA